jgi:hypothetical protein
MKTILKISFIVSGIIPATILLLLTLYFLFDNIINPSSFSVAEILFNLSMVFGILGYTGLIISLIPKLDSKYSTKISLLGFGIVGFVLVVNIAGRENAWSDLLTFENFKNDFNGYILWLWPSIVSLTLLIYNILKLVKRTSK